MLEYKMPRNKFFKLYKILSTFLVLIVLLLAFFQDIKGIFIAIYNYPGKLNESFYSSNWELFSNLFPQRQTESIITVYTSKDSDLKSKIPSFDNMHVILEIPSVNIYGKVLDGNTDDVLNHGFWHYPNGADLVNYGNIVIIGHRYLKMPPAKDTFFNLDKVKKGDIIILHSKYGDWRFVVNKIRVVDKSNTKVLNNTRNFKLTIFTCHPLWSSKERLVIEAVPVDNLNEM